MATMSAWSLGSALYIFMTKTTLSGAPRTSTRGWSTKASQAWMSNVVGGHALDGLCEFVVETTGAIDVFSGVAQTTPGEQGASDDDYDMLRSARMETFGHLFHERLDLGAGQGTAGHLR